MKRLFIVALTNQDTPGPLNKPQLIKAASKMITNRETRTEEVSSWDPAKDML